MESVALRRVPSLQSVLGRVRWWYCNRRQGQEDTLKLIEKTSPCQASHDRD